MNKIEITNEILEKAEYEIRKAGADLDAMKAIGFKYDLELIASPILQAEQFCKRIICASFQSTWE